MEQVIHLKTTLSFREMESASESALIIKKFIESCMQLDVSLFEPFMNEEDNFEDKDKYRFLERLRKSFEEYRQDLLDDFIVERTTTICEGCSYGKRVEQFKVYEGESKKFYDDFGFLIDENNGKLIDIYQCNQYKGCKMVTIGGGSSNFPEITISEQVLKEEHRKRLNKQ
ncbi:MAG: hypothetical protein WCK67_08485 [bacterium]